MTHTRGSEWLRWDVHLHAPGTALANEFPSGSWDTYIKAINVATPAAVALGITDYLSIDDYVEVRRRWKAGELPGVRLVFPNVEFRLSVNTEKTRSINIHLFFSTDDDDHVERIRERIGLLQFTFACTQYVCTRGEATTPLTREALRAALRVRNDRLGALVRYAGDNAVPVRARRPDASGSRPLRRGRAMRREFEALPKYEKAVYGTGTNETIVVESDGAEFLGDEGRSS